MHVALGRSRNDSCGPSCIEIRQDYTCAAPTDEQLVPRPIPQCARSLSSSAGVHDGDGRFRALVDLSPDAILIHEAGRFVYANPAAVGLLRAQGPEQILGMLATSIVHADCRHLAEVRTQLLLEGESRPPVDLRWLRFDGTVVDVEVSASPLASSRGFSVQVFSRDISARIEAQRQREAAEHG